MKAPLAISDLSQPTQLVNVGVYISVRTNHQEPRALLFTNSRWVP